MSASGFWVISVNRTTGEATTSELITDKDEAWGLSLRLQEPNIYTTVVPRRPSAPPRGSDGSDAPTEDSADK